MGELSDAAAWAEIRRRHAHIPQDVFEGMEGMRPPDVQIPAVLDTAAIYAQLERSLKDKAAAAGLEYVPGSMGDVEVVQEGDGVAVQAKGWARARADR